MKPILLWIILIRFYLKIYFSLSPRSYIFVTEEFVHNHLSFISPILKNTRVNA